MSSVSPHCTATTHSYPLSLHDALPIFVARDKCQTVVPDFVNNRIIHHRRSLQAPRICFGADRKSTRLNLQSPCNLVCRLLLEKKKKIKYKLIIYIYI